MAEKVRETGKHRYVCMYVVMNDDVKIERERERDYLSIYL